MVKNTTTGEYLRCGLDDPRFLSGEYVGVRTGTTMNNKTKEALSKANEGTIPVRDTLTGETFRCDRDDANYKSGRYVYANKGSKHPVSTCPHCGKVGAIGHMKRWHNDNCRYKNRNT